MNDSKRNIVVVNLDDKFVNDRLFIKEKEFNSRFPHIVYVNSLEEAYRKEGFMLVTLLEHWDKLYNDISSYVYDGEEMPDLYEFDRLNCHYFKNFCYVLILSIDYYPFLDGRHGLYSKFQIFDEFGYGDRKTLIYDLYDEYLKQKEKKYSKKQLSNIKALKDYLDMNKKKVYYTSEEIMLKFNVSNKWVLRYMKEMNNIYNNIGYNPKIRKWYVVK